MSVYDGAPTLVGLRGYPVVETIESLGAYDVVSSCVETQDEECTQRVLFAYVSWLVSLPRDLAGLSISKGVMTNRSCSLCGPVDCSYLCVQPNQPSECSWPDRGWFSIAISFAGSHTLRSVSSWYQLRGLRHARHSGRWDRPPGGCSRVSIC